MTNGQPLVRRRRTCAALVTTLALLGWNAPSDAGITLRSATQPGGNTYRLVADRSATWSSAASSAAAGGGYLASITSAAEQAFVQQLLDDAAAPAGSYWIGLQKSAAGFAWTNDEPLIYQNWLPGQPDDNGGNETVGAMLWSKPGDNAAGTPGAWNDLPDPYFSGRSFYDDLNNGGYVVEQNESGQVDGPSPPPAAVPLPAAALLAPIGLIAVGIAVHRMQRARDG